MRLRTDSPPAALRVAREVISRMNTGLLAVSAVAVVVLGIAVLTSVYSRYVMGQPLTWTNDVARLALSLCIFAALPVAMEHGAHVSLDLELRRAPDWVQLLRDLVRWLVLGGIFVWWLWMSVERSLDARADGHNVGGLIFDLPAWIPYGIQSLLLLQLAVTALLFPGGRPASEQVATTPEMP